MKLAEYDEVYNWYVLEHTRKKWTFQQVYRQGLNNKIRECCNSDFATITYTEQLRY